MTVHLALGHRFGQEVAALTVFDFHHPNVGIIAGLASDKAIEIGLRLGFSGLHPDRLSVAAHGLGIEADLAADRIVDLDQHSASAGIALTHHNSRGLAQLGPPDQGRHPDIGGQQQFITPLTDEKAREGYHARFPLIRRAVCWKSRAITSRPGQQKAFTGAAALASALCFAAPAFAQSASELLYERTVMSAADSRCRLFDRPTSSALQAGAAQVRGTALRAGMTTKQLVQARATAKASRVACNASDLVTAATRVRTGFAG